MDVQDYEYYEARAKDVKMEDITSDEDNADILERLRDNDPDFTHISIGEEFTDESDFVVREGEDLGWLGYFVGRSKELEYLTISDLPDNLNIDSFLRGLGQNRSIEILGISTDLGEESFQTLVPFLRNNNSLEDLTFIGYNAGLQCARNIGSLFGQQCSLRCLHFEDNNLGDEELVEIASALRTKLQIEDLNLCYNHIGRDGCVALGSALEGMRNPNLATLDLGRNNIDDEGLHALVAGLINCHNLTTLCLSENGMITAAGLRSLSTLLRSDHCRLEHLLLYQMNMDNDGVTVLAAGLARLPTLNKLNLEKNHIGDQGLKDLVGSLSATRLNTLSVCNNNINDEGIKCLVEGLVNCCSLQTLDLSNNQSITCAGLRTLSTFFQSDNCCLKDLWLREINFGDEGAVALANRLSGNESLTDLWFDLSGITARGWTAFSKLLCDTASVNNTYLSNHTLERIGGYFHPNTPSDINCATATCKILDSHPDIDVEPLFQWKLKCLPLVVSWFENARSYLGNVNESTEVFQCRQLSALYKFVRGMPQLAVDGYRGKNTTDIQPKSKKRKLDLDQTL
eukprot:scaffold328_cov95-Skeletonema_dohrnii-CCMP3373.AAC.7